MHCVEHTYENTVKIFSILNKGIKKRGITYKNMRRSTATIARKMFNKCLAKKGHSGDLKFQHSDSICSSYITRLESVTLSFTIRMRRTYYG